MPAKLERCVEEVMKKKGLSKEKAYAICNASLNDGIVFDFKSKLNLTIDETTGFFTSDVVLSRVGVQEYYGFELGLSDDQAFQKFGVFRPPEEVFNQDSIRSFVNMVVTDDHPSGLVTVSNVKDLQVGTVSSPQADEKNGIVKGIITITDRKQIEKTENGKIKVSLGYVQNLIQKDGVYNGENYQFVQTKIRGNHLAIVDAGRCGAACRIITDHDKRKGENIMIITIDGIEYDVENKQLAQAIQNQQKAHDASEEEMKKKIEEKDEELEEMKKKKEEAEATKDAALKKVLTDEQLSEVVKSHVELIVDAKMILGDKMPECGICPKEIKSAIIDHVYGETDFSGKTDDYINAMFDLALKDVKGSKEGFEKFKKDMGDKTKDKKTISRDSARTNYMKSIGLEV